MKINIKHVAKLASLTIDNEEEKKFENQLSQVLDYVNKLNELDTSDVEPSAQVTGLKNVQRNDHEALPCLTADEALKNAKSKNNNLFKVKAILQEE